jgi:hypothetical protein
VSFIAEISLPVELPPPKKRSAARESSPNGRGGEGMKISEAEHAINVVMVTKLA